MNNDVYNNKGTSSLDEAYARLNEAIKKRNVSSTNQQYDNTNGVALNTTPLQVNEQQTEDADWFTRTYATGLEAYKNVQRGLLSSFEGIIDFGLQLAGIFDKEWAEKAIAYDITDTILKATDVDSHIYRAVTGKELLDQSWLNEANEKIQDTVVSVEQGVGNVIGMLALGKLGGAEGASINLPTFGLMTASGGGQTVEGVFADPNYSGDYLGAVGYGLASGATEAVIETVSGKVGDVFNNIAAKTGIKALENTAGVFTGNYAGKNFGGRLASMLISSVSEGGEEVLSEIADPFIKTIYTKESVGESWQNNFSKEQLDEVFLIGTLTSMITNGGVAIDTVNQARKYGLDAQGNINTATVIELQKVNDKMLYMSKNQGQYSQDEYNKKMTELAEKQLDLGKQLETTKSGSARNRLDNLLKENQLDSATLQSEEFNKKVEFHTETQERIDEFKKMIDKVNNNVDFNEQFDVTFEASKKPLKAPDGGDVDAYYDSNKKKIVFSKTISPNKAFNFLASHELKHHFDTMAELREVNEKILDKIKISGNYEAKKAKLKKLGYKEKEADEEMVADYIGELFKKGGDFDFLTMTKEEADLSAQKLAAVRRETSDLYIRARYAEAIAKLKNAETYREPTKAVAYNKAEVKYSRADEYDDFDFDLDILLEEDIELSEDELEEFNTPKYQYLQSLKEKEDRRFEYEMLTPAQKQTQSIYKRLEHGYTKLAISLNKFLSPAFKERYKDSKVRYGKISANTISNGGDSRLNGLLVPMFHGTPNPNMNFFDSKRIGTNGTMRGAGFYLTDDFSYARSYAKKEGKVIMSFVNITKPLSTTSREITKDEFAKFARRLKLDPRSEKIQELLKETSDAELINNLYDIANVGFDYFVNQLEHSLGYDGIIYANRAVGTVVIAFKSNQIKDVANLNPTDDPDIRYSRADTKYSTQPAEKLTAELKEGKVYNRNVGNVIFDVLESDLDTNNFRFDISREKVLEETSKLLNLNDVDSIEFNDKLEKFAKELTKSIKVEGKPILEYFKESDSSTTYSDIYEFVTYDIIDALKQVSIFKGRVSQMTRKNLEIKKSKESLALQKEINDNLSEVIKEKMATIKELRKNNIKTVKYVSQIERIKSYAKNFEKNKIFKNGSIKELAQEYYNLIKSINVTKSSTRNIVVQLKGAFEHSLIKGEKQIIDDVETYPNDIMKPTQREYLKTAFDFLEKRIKTNDGAIDFSNNIENLNEFNDDFKSISNKTEGEVIADVLRMFRKVTNEANNKKAVLNGTEYDIHELLEKEVELQNNNKRNTTKAQEGLVKTIKQVSSSFYDPQFWFNLLGNNVENSFFNEVFKELQNAENKKLKIKYDLQKDVNDYIRKNKSVIKKINNKKNLVEIAKGKSIPLITVVDMYMTAKTDNSESHFFNEDWGGVTYKGTHITSEDIIGLLDKGDQENLKSVTSENKEEIYAECKKKLIEKLEVLIGSDTKELIQKLEAGYKKSTELYKQVAIEKDGFRYKTKDYYYPVSVNKNQFNVQTGTLESNNNFINNVMQPSFTKAVVKNAGNELRLENPIDRFYNFTNKLACWAGMSESVKTIDRFLNSHIKTPNGRTQSMREYIKEFIDPDFDNRYNDLVKSMQDIPVTPKNPVDKFFNKVRGLMASTTLSFKSKTIISQFFAYLKFMQYGHYGNMIKAFGKNSNFISFDDLLTSSPLIYDRYYGNQGRNIADAHSVGASGTLNRFGQLGMEGITWADKVALKWGWKKTQLDAMAMGITDKAEVIKLFEQRVNETQASHNAINNGSATRVNNEMAKTTLIFTAESRKTLSRFFESIYKISKEPKNKKYWQEFAGVSTAMVSNAALMALLATVLSKLKGNDEEEEFVESLGKEFSANLVSIFPIITNIYNKIVLGYDFEIAGLTQLTDLLDIPKYCEQLMETGATEAQKTSAIMQISQRLAHICGVPFKNIYNELLQLAGLGDLAFDSNMVMKLRNFYYNTDSKTTSTLIKTYSKRNDMEKLSAMIQVRNEKFGAGKINDKVSNEMARLYNKGVLETFPSQLQSEYTVDGVIHKLNKTQYKQAQDIYSLANEAMELMVVSSQYSGLSDDEKAQAIKKLYGAYYEASKTSVINASEGTKLSKVVKYIDSGKFASYLAKIDGLKASTTTNKKSVVQSYINRLGISKNEKYLLAHLAGYSISDEAKKAVSTYLRSKGMAYKDSNEYFK